MRRLASPIWHGLKAGWDTFMPHVGMAGVDLLLKVHPLPRRWEFTPKMNPILLEKKTQLQVHRGGCAPGPPLLLQHSLCRTSAQPLTLKPFGFAWSLLERFCEAKTYSLCAPNICSKHNKMFSSVPILDMRGCETFKRSPSSREMTSSL